ncbi:ATP phosphoribosyltransferase regulatory subunit [Thermoanaerobaculum aquaticum]|nr:ATP phosphoribosyltransferase regulatory subunit [Thermoanaerobaculum aquaticum]
MMTLHALPAEGARLYEAQYLGMRWLVERGFRPVLLPLVYPVNGEEDGGFRFLDGEGRVWGVRADFTPLIGRAVSGELAEGRTLRVCYAGEVARREAARLRGVREFMQLGFESFNVENEAAATVELLLGLLKEVGLPLEGLALTVSHTGLGEEILGLLTEEAPDPELLEMLAAKDADGVTSLLGLRGEAAFYLRQAVFDEGSNWVRFFGQEQAWQRLQAAAAPARAQGVAVRFELVPRSSAHYYRGVVFSLWGSRGKGLLASGGEYRAQGKLGLVPAVGATVALDQVLAEGAW